MIERASAKESSLRVLYFSTFVSRESGASYALRQMVRRVARSGIRSTVVIPDSLESREMFSDQEFDVVYLEMQRPRRTFNFVTHASYCLSFPKTLLALRRLIRDRNVQIVHCNEITDFIAAFAAKLSGVPCVYQVRHDGIPNPYRRVLTLTLKTTADAIVVPSKSTATWLGSDVNSLAERISLIYDYAFDPDEYQTGTSGIAVRRELGIGSNEIFVILVSKLVTPKGHLCFVRAAEIAQASSTRIRFAIVGGPVPGHEGEALTIQALARKVAPSILFLGARLDLAEVYAACDIAVHCPIYPDTYPTVVLLPMLMGKPVIGTRIGGIPEQIEHGKTGVLVPPDDPGALARAFLDLAQDPCARATFGGAAMKKLRGELATQAQGSLLAELYRKVWRYHLQRTGASSPVEA
jgi:glycosyltransferase involved in cell wall biosynthesis